jgi:hypothetical protein
MHTCHLSSSACPLETSKKGKYIYIVYCERIRSKLKYEDFLLLLLLLYRLFLLEERSHTILTEIFNKNYFKEKSQKIKGLIGFNLL